MANKIVVIDDPMSSLDDHRTLVTVEEVVKMSRRVKQMVVLSHSKPFLLSLWKSGPKNSRAAMRISRAQNGSAFEVWRANEDSVTEHDRRYSRVQAYITASNPAAERTVAADLRPMLEAWARVAYPIEFPPEEMLGGFINRCEQVAGTANQVMKQADIDELRGLTNYANLFHHDTNPTFETEHINDQQLAQFASRTLRFIRKAYAVSTERGLETSRRSRTASPHHDEIDWVERDLQHFCRSAFTDAESTAHTIRWWRQPLRHDAAGLRADIRTVAEERLL